MLDNFRSSADESYLANTGWMCPDVSVMTLENYFGSLEGFNTFWYELHYCDTAASLLNYTDPNCETDHNVTN